MLGAVIATALLCIWLAGKSRPWLHGPSASERRHKRKVSSASAALATVSRINPRANPARAFGYLRKVDPYVFEEMILTELEARGHVIKRNPRYSGDGGADGAFTLNGRLWLIQAKRYSGAVNAADVTAFDRLCREQGARGLFVHTGRTTGGSRTVENASGFIRIISGEDLVSFFAGDGLRLSPQLRGKRLPPPSPSQKESVL